MSCHHLLSMVVLAALTQHVAGDSSVLQIGKFSTASEIPDHWQVISYYSIDNPTQYTLNSEQGSTVIKAISKHDASALVRQIEYDPKRYPYLNWRWKIEAPNPKSNINERSGDDYPARLYVMFDYDVDRLSVGEQLVYALYNFLYGIDLPLANLNYVWGNRTPIGETQANAYSDRVRMIVLKNHTSRTQSWYQEERNIYLDYKQAFGEEPGNVIGIAIMTDTDNTAETSVAYYGDITATAHGVAGSRNNHQ